MEALTAAIRAAEVALKALADLHTQAAFLDRITVGNELAAAADKWFDSCVLDTDISDARVACDSLKAQRAKLTAMAGHLRQQRTASDALAMQLTQPNDAAVVAVKAQLARITALSAVVEETLTARATLAAQALAEIEQGAQLMAKREQLQVTVTRLRRELRVARFNLEEAEEEGAPHQTVADARAAVAKKRAEMREAEAALQALQTLTPLAVRFVPKWASVATGTGSGGATASASTNEVMCPGCLTPLWAAETWRH